jgi:hypothetical protein
MEDENPDYVLYNPPVINGDQVSHQPYFGDAALGSILPTGWSLVGE